MTVNQATLISIYDAALSKQNWRHALDACAEIIGADGAMLYEFPNTDRVSYSIEETSSSFGKIAHHLAEYNKVVAEGRGSNYDQEGLGHVQGTPAYSVTLDEDVWTMDEAYFARPEVEIGMRAGFLRRSLVNLSDDPIKLSGIIFLYGRQFDAAMPQQVRTAGPLLAPHMSKAMEIHRFTHGLRAKYNAVLSVLDRIGTGVLVVSKDANIIVSNRLATQALEADDGLRKPRTGILSARDPDTDAALRATILDVSATANGENDKSGHVVQIKRAGTDAALIAIVSPLRDAEMEIEKGLTGALVTLIDPLNPVKVQSELMALAYGLTTAEARVADFLLKGLTNAEIAERVGVSPETIKTQISSVLNKCGCRNRLSFVWRVFQLAPPIT